MRTLDMRPIGTADELERRRRRAVQLVHPGEQPATVARILGVGRPSLYTWSELDRTDPDALAAKPHPGPRPRLTDAQLERLEALLLRGAKAHGWPDDTGSARRVADLIRRRFGVDYHVEHVRKLLRRRLRRTSQKPRRRARGHDPVAIDH
jgi:transposase